MKKTVIFRLFCIAALWLIFCGWLLNRYVETGTPFNIRTLLPIVVSGGIIFVPLYKKYFKNNARK